MNAQSEHERDYFTDRSVLLDPYEYLEEIRSHGPVYQLQSRDIVAVTGYSEAVEVLRNNNDFSSVITTSGPTLPLPFEPQGTDITDQIEQFRNQIPGSSLLVAYDGAVHTASRSLLARLFTPSRLRDNQAFLTGLAERMVADAVRHGGCELMLGFATRYTSLVMADLLGVPEEDRERFADVLRSGPPPGDINGADGTEGAATLEGFSGAAGKTFANYIQDRRQKPRDDVLSELANASFPDGTIPDIEEVVRLSLFLFAAGQDTSAKLLGNAMRYLCEIPGLQDQLRGDRSQIVPFLEEVLRMEGSSKVTFRLAKRNCRIGDTDIPAGKKIVIFLAAASRDPDRWENPNEFRMNRPRANEHLAFGRGVHTCIGAPLARTEARIVLDRFLEHTSRIQLSERHHGTPGDRQFQYDPSFITRGLRRLYIDLESGGDR